MQINAELGYQSNNTMYLRMYRNYDIDLQIKIQRSCGHGHDTILSTNLITLPHVH